MLYNGIAFNRIALNKSKIFLNAGILLNGIALKKRYLLTMEFYLKVF